MLFTLFACKFIKVPLPHCQVSQRAHLDPEYHSLVDLNRGPGAVPALLEEEFYGRIVKKFGRNCHLPTLVFITGLG